MIQAGGLSLGTSSSPGLKGVRAMREWTKFIEAVAKLIHAIAALIYSIKK